MPAPKRELHFNGIQLETGQPLDLPRTHDELAAAIPQLTNPIPSIVPTLPQWLKALAALAPVLGGFERWLWSLALSPTLLGRLTSLSGRDTRDLSEAGWALVLPKTMEPGRDDTAILQALRPLLDLRSSQVGPDRFRLYWRETGIAPGESAAQWLARVTTLADGVPPWYLLLAGSPKEIPFQVQRDLFLEHAVGRIHFEHVTRAPWMPEMDAYRRYADAVVLSETEGIPRQRKAAVLATRHENDPATHASHEGLAVPLADRLRDGGWDVEALFGNAPTESALRWRLGCPLEDTPNDATRRAFVATVTHGLAVEPGSTLRRSDQGAIICADWDGYPGGSGAAAAFLSPQMYVAADDLGGVGSVGGLVTYHFACFGVGTDRLLDGSPCDAFVAALPQALLGHPNGASLAFIGHCNLLWDHSFRDRVLSGSPTWAHDMLLDRLSSGMSVGSAMRGFAARFLALTALRAGRDWLQVRARLGSRKSVDVWTAWQDASDFMVLGDPAVRLAVA